MSVDVVARSVDFTDSEVATRSIFNAVLHADWRQALVARGYGWHVDVGAFSTPIVGGGAGTVIDLDRPEFGLSVPTGYCLIPLRFHAEAKPGVQTTDAHETEIVFAVDRVAAWVGDGTVTAETPLNMRTNVATGCPVSAFSAATADITDPVLGYELGHSIQAQHFGDATGTEMANIRLLYEPLTSPFLLGPCAVYGYWGGDIAAAGFASLDFIVVPSIWVTALS